MASIVQRMVAVAVAASACRFRKILAMLAKRQRLRVLPPSIRFFHTDMRANHMIPIAAADAPVVSSLASVLR